MILYKFLQNLKLLEFHSSIVNKLEVTELYHFQFITEEDLSKIGLTKTDIRRVTEVLKERRIYLKKPKKFSKIVPKQIAHFLKSPEPTPSFTAVIEERDLRLKDTIGEGTFAIVKTAEWISFFGKQIVAVKILKKSYLSHESLCKDFLNEVKLMNKLTHPNVIRIHGMVLSTPFKLIMELAPLGSLLVNLRKEPTHISISTMITYALQIACGMDYLEKSLYVHRDLAARNIFLFSLTHLKIGDFGLTKELLCNQDIYVMRHKKPMPINWSAPESIRYGEFSHASDTWMYGITLWEIFTYGQQPWANCRQSEIMVNYYLEKKRLERPVICSPQIYFVMQQCWSLAEIERPSFSALYDFFSRLTPLKIKSKQVYNNNFMKIEIGDTIEVIHREPYHLYWMGQNLRTREIGPFPFYIKHKNKEKAISKELGSRDYPPDILGYKENPVMIQRLKSRGDFQENVREDKTPNEKSLFQLFHRNKYIEEEVIHKNVPVLLPCQNSKTAPGSESLHLSFLNLTCSRASPIERTSSPETEYFECVEKFSRHSKISL